MLAVEIAETVFEAREGGRIYDRGVDGSECQWARVPAYEPPERVVFSCYGWESERDGVGGEGGWPLYLQRFADLLKD
jgi:hypothetical protein